MRTISADPNYCNHTEQCYYPIRVSTPSVESIRWVIHSSTLSTKAHQARHLWDLRWHAENVRVAKVQAEAAATCCLLCQGPHTQTHVLCDCPHLGPERRAVYLDIHLATHRYPPGPQRMLATACTRLLQDGNLGDARGQLWTGL